MAKKPLQPDLQAAVDQRLEDALKASNYRITLNVRRSNARLKLERDLTFARGGGMFKASPELIAFVGALLGQGKVDATLLDANQNPVVIDDLQQFMTDIIARYYEFMNEYLTEHRAVQKARTTKALIG
jgi:hypothetical protein